MPATAVEQEHRVTPRELFFDLVFVFAFTQVTTLLAHDPTFAGIGRGVLVLGALWWSWTAYAWLTNTVDPEQGAIRLAVFAAMAALLVASLAVPHAFGDDALVFGVAYAVVRLMHLTLYVIASRQDAALRFATVRLARSMVPAAALIV